MQTPVIVGMPRSASRATWQIAKVVSFQKSRPDYYVIPEERDWASPLSDTWPCRTHKYISSLPVIYTFRHPVEAFLSLRTKYKIDLGKEGSHVKTEADCASAALGIVCTHLEIYRKLVLDSYTCRPILFLRYEDYYGKHDERVKKIINFMGAQDNIDRSTFEVIMETTSLKRNFDIGVNISKNFPEAPFSYIEDDVSGLQRDHVSKETMGIPGAWLANAPDDAQDILMLKKTRI